MTYTEHKSRLDVMSRRGAGPRAGDVRARESLSITKDPVEYFPPNGSAASPLGKAESFGRIHGLVPHMR
jgi:hypothetical protein